MTNVLQISLDTLAKVVSTLSSAVSSGYGPSSQHTIVSTATGNVLITNQGLQILRMIEVSHPVAKLVIASIADFHKIAGDDSKTFIILLNELFIKFQRQLCANNCHSSTTQRQASSIMSHKLSHDITYALNEMLPSIFQSMDRYCVRTPSSPMPSKNLENLVRGTLRSHVHDYDADHLSSLLVTFISHWHSSKRPTLRSTLNHLIKHQKCLIVEDVGKSVSMSTLIPGLLISRGFCNYRNSSNESKGIKFILLSCSMDTNKDENDTIEVNISDMNCKGTASSWIEHKRMRVETFILLVKQLHVSLIITSSQFSTLEKNLATLNGIKLVDMVEDEELELLSMHTNKEIIHDTLDINVHHVGTLESCRQMSIGSQIYVNLQPESLPLPCSLVVSGPSESTSRQSRHLLMDCLQVIRSALVSHDDPFYFCSRDIGREFSRESVSSCRQDSRTSNTFRKHPEHLSPLSTSTADCEAMSYEKDVDSEWLYTISVGGMFELSLRDQIIKYMRNGSATSLTLSILSEALFIIAQLPANSIAKPWLTVAEMRQGHQLEISQDNLTHSFPNKCHLIVCVLTMFRQLLRLVQHA